MTHPQTALGGSSLNPATSRADAGQPPARAFIPKLRVLDLFSGSGGMSLGLERTGGFQTVAHCEIEPFARRILHKHWPEVRCYDDVTTADFAALGPVDLVTAGFPCQDISFAGKGAGLAGERSGLFWHVIRAASLVGWPQLLLENVAGLLNRGMGAVLGALASVGYDTEWHCIPASAVGAPHRRDRIWIVADAKRPGSQGFIADHGLSVSNRSTFTLDCDGSVEGWCRVAERSAPVRNGDGLRPGVDRSRIKLMGNSVVPQIPELIGRAILNSLLTRQSARGGSAADIRTSGFKLDPQNLPARTGANRSTPGGIIACAASGPPTA